MTLANNHLNDYGDLPVNYTINALIEVGIKAVGVSYGPYNSHQVIQNLKKKQIKRCHINNPLLWYEFYLSQIRDLIAVELNSKRKHAKKGTDGQKVE